MLASFAYLDTSLETQNVANNGKRLTLTPEVLGQRLDDVSAADQADASAAACARRTRSSSTPPTPSAAPGYHLVDGLASTRQQHLTLRLNIYNLTDEVYIRNVNNNGGRYNPGNPRSLS